MKVKLFTIYPSHIISYGSSGTGKSVNTRWLLEYFYERGRKIIDIYDDGRLENCFIALSNTDIWMNDIYNNWVKRFNTQWTPKGYPTECYIPAYPNTPKKLPSIFKPFTIAFDDLTRQELMILLGKLSTSQMDLIGLIWDHFHKEKTFQNFINITQDFITDTKIKVNNKIVDVCDDKLGLSILQKLERLNRLGIISDKKDPRNLDLDKIMKDQETITCFSFTFLESQNTKHLLWGYLFRKIYTTRLEKLYYQYPECIIGHRELQNNAPARGKKSSFAYEGQAISLEFIKKIIAEPRDIKLRLIADSQDPMRIDIDVRKGFKTRYIFQLDKAVLDNLIQQFWLDPKTYIGCQYLDVGQHAIKTIPQRSHPHNRRGIQFPCMNPPPNSLCKKPDDLFFKIWRYYDLPFTTHNFKKPKSILSIKKLTKEEREIVNIKTESVYDTYEKVIKIALENYPDGISITDLLQDPLLSRMNWESTKIYRSIERMANKDPPEIIRTKSGRAWICSLN